MSNYWYSLVFVFSLKSTKNDFYTLYIKRVILKNMKLFSQLLAAAAPLLLAGGVAVLAQLYESPEIQVRKTLLATAEAIEQDNVEVVVKVIDACQEFGKYWVFAAGLTDVETDLQVVDSQTNASRSYVSAVGEPFSVILDTQSFDCE